MYITESKGCDVMDSMIKKVGISECHDKKMKFFSQFYSREIIDIPDNMTDIEQVVSIIVSPQICSLKSIDTMKGISEEGQHLTGKKIIVEIELKQKILYTSCKCDQRIHVIENSFFQSAYIVVPPSIEGTEIDLLLKYNCFIVNVYTEDIVIRKQNNRKLFKAVYLLLEAKFKPTFALCYSQKENCSISNIFMSFENGKNVRQLTFEQEYINLFPVWSSNGQQIAFLSNKDGKYLLYVYYIKLDKTYRIIHDKKFNCITSFCWGKDDINIFFTGVVCGRKEIFSVDIKNLKYKQLTFGNGMVQSFKPKCSLNGKKIAYLNSCGNINDLCFMDYDGGNYKKITECKCVKDFDWCSDNTHIVYIVSRKLNKDVLYKINTKNFEEKFISLPIGINTIKHVLCSPNRKYIAFIGNNCRTEDIYIYDMESNCTTNVTNNNENITISDYVWKVDGSKIYFSANYLGYCNIYSLDIKKKTFTKITNTTALDIQLNYRSRII